MSEPTPAAQPYVGPRPFDRADRGLFFGRERETEDLFNTLIAQRLVLLHSPSGAGKSSLINVALIPLLERERFAVFAPIRVSDQRALEAGGNRFIAATLLALDLQPPAPAEGAPDLATLLDSRPREPGDDREELLIFDQFEEVLTVDPADRPTKERFFRELGEALENSRRWALFAMREEYLGALRPFVDLLPTRLAALYRLDLLSTEQAIDAIQGPAAGFGVTFELDAAKKLVADLGRVQVERPDGGSEEVVGEYVEPVQLQVACRRLWSKRFGQAPPPPGARITLAELNELVDVNRALAEYYEEELAGVARLTGVNERALRDWFDEQLITPDGRRGQVRRVQEQSGGLSAAAIRALIDAHLVRGEERRGSTWYELAHDRLIKPIRDSNDEWRGRTLNAFQQAALLWDREGRQKGRLLRDEALAAAQAWAETHEQALTAREREFLNACFAEQAILENEALENQRERQRLWNLAVGLAFVAAVAVAVALSYIALDARRQAQAAALNAQVGRLATEALAAQEREPQRSLLMGTEAVSRSLALNLRPASAEESLREALAAAGGFPLRAHHGPVAAVAFSPDGALLATGSADTTVRLWRTQAPGEPPFTLRGHGGGVQHLLFSADGSLLASAGQDGTVRIWSVVTPEAAPRVLPGHLRGVMALALHPTQPLLLSGSEDAIRLWDLRETGSNSVQLQGAGRGLSDLAFSPDGRWIGATAENRLLLWATSATTPTHTLSVPNFALTSLAFSTGGLVAAGNLDGTVSVWSVDQPAQEPRTFAGHTQQVNELRFSADGQRLISASLDGTVRVWSVATPEQPLADLRGHSGPLRGIALSADDSWIASAGEDQTARLWRPDEGQALVLRGHAGPLNAVAFSADGRQLATVSDDGMARLWWVGSPSTSPDVVTGAAPGNGLTKALFSPDGTTLATASFDGTARLWRIDRLSDPPAILNHADSVYSLAFSPDSALLATGSNNALRVYRTSEPAAPPTEHVVEGVVAALAFSPDQRWLAAAAPRDGLLLWPADRLAAEPLRLPEPAEPSDLRFSADGALLLAWSPAELQIWDLRAADAPRLVENSVRAGPSAVATGGGGRLATGYADGRVELWNSAALASPPEVLSGAGGRVFALAFDQAGERLAVGAAEGSVQLWDLARVDEGPQSLPGHIEDVYGLAFSPDGDWLATASLDDTGRLFNLTAPGQASIALRGHSADLFTVSFDATGSRLLTGSNDGTVRLWRVGSATLLELACTAAGRNLNLAEWRGLFGDEPYRRTCAAYGHDASFFTAALRDEQLDGEQLRALLQAYTAEQQADAGMAPPELWLVQAALYFLSPPVALDEAGPAERLALADQAFQLAVERDETLAAVDALTFDALCRIGWEQSRLELALEGCNRALAIDPRNGNFHFNRAHVRAALRQYDAAIEDLETFLEWAPGLPDYERRKLQVDGWIATLEAREVPEELRR